MSRIIMPGEHEGLTPKQRSQALTEKEIPPCEGPEPGVVCQHPKQNIIILGYDDKPRCASCNKIHLGLVEREAGSSTPNSPVKHVTPRLQDHSKRKAAIDRVYKNLEGKGHRGRPTQSVSTRRIAEGDFKDMKDAQSRDEFKTREAGISREERMKRIRAKYVRRG